MTFRTAQASDAPILAAISIEVWIGTYLRQGVGAVFAEFALREFTTDRMAAMIADPSNHVIVSENTEGLDGFMRIGTSRTAPVAGCSTVEIVTLYVQPRHHGRGIGRALLDRGLAWAGAGGASSVWLTTNTQNAPAIAFYLSRGFRRIGRTDFWIDGEAYPNDVFSRDLGSAV